MVEITMYELLDRLGLEYTDRGYLKMCPFCGKKKHILHVDNERGLWRCNACGESGGVLHFYAKYVLSTSELPILRPDWGVISGELQKFMGHTDTEIQAKPVQKKQKETSPIVPIASDERIDAVYSVMSDFPILALSDKHKKHLLSRGLTIEAIERNGYRTMPDTFTIPASYVNLYNKEGGEATRKIIFKGHEYVSPAKDIQLGLLLADLVVRKGLDPTGVPGFFRFGNSWCFRVTPGIMIPTRNMFGQNVLWQVRVQNARPGGKRYYTNHNGGLPGAVKDGVSRCHFPLGNAPINPDVPFIITEGPLKADVACCLCRTPIIFAAILGVSNTADLLKCVEVLKKMGIKTMQNGLDMDKITKKSVRDGSDALMAKLHERGVTVLQLYWGEQYARFKLASFLQIAKIRNIPVPQYGNTVYDHLRAVSEALDDAKILPCESIDEKGKAVSFYWEPATKGIDDYYLDYFKK